MGRSYPAWDLNSLEPVIGNGNRVTYGNGMGRDLRKPPETHLFQSTSPSTLSPPLVLLLVLVSVGWVADLVVSYLYLFRAE